METSIKIEGSESTPPRAEKSESEENEKETEPDSPGFTLQNHAPNSCPKSSYPPKNYKIPDRRELSCGRAHSRKPLRGSIDHLFLSLNYSPSESLPEFGSWNLPPAPGCKSH